MNPFKESFVFLVGLGLILGASAGDFLVCGNDGPIVDPPQCPPFEQIPTYYPYPYDCTKYFVCTNGYAQCIQCAVGTRWDQNLTTCNHAAVIDCVIVTTTGSPLPTTETTPTTTTPTTTTSTAAPTTEPPTTTTEAPTESPTTTSTSTTTVATTVDPEPSTEPPTEPPTSTPTPTTTSSSSEPPQTTTRDPADWVCEEGYSGSIGHPYDCSQFYICEPGRKPCLYSCEDGLLYSPITKDCEWPWDVPECQGGTPPPPSNLSPVNYRNVPRSHKSGFVETVMKRRSEGQEPCPPR